MEQRAERRLAAIMAADVAGYSRLMGADEDGTLAQLKGHRRALVDPKIREHRGEIVKTTGDGMLVEFSSAIDAVRSCVEIQRGMAERNASVPADKRIEFRVGINVGDIIHDERDIFGDGVNVAARLEGLAEPGGICVSQSVRDAVREKLGFAFEDIGEQALKNIAVPIHTYRVRFGGDLPAHTARIHATPRRRNLVGASVIGLAALCALAAIAVVMWPRRAPPIVAQPAAAVATTSLPLPDKPSVAVLPFSNIGGDARQERLADGITEDVITDLSRYRELFVIAGNSVFAYKGKTISLKDVGRDLGVRFVLEGSIQTSGERVRVTAQLIEVATGSHVWSDRYDRPLDDIFDVQNDVTQKIAAALGGPAGVIRVADAASASRKRPGNLQAYDYVVLGVESLARQTREDNFKAEELYQRAIELDPKFARAYNGLSAVYENRANVGWQQEEPSVLFEKAKAALLQAIALDSTDGKTYAMLGNVYFELSDFDHGLAALEQAFVLNPNDPQVLIRYGRWLSVDGRPREGVEMVDRAFRLNPHFPDWYNNFVDPFYVTQQYDRVITMTRRKRGDVFTWSYLVLAMSYAQSGRATDAMAAVAELLMRDANFSLERGLGEFGGIRHEPTLALYFDGARKAGLRECATATELQKYPNMKRLALCDAKRATN